MKDEFIISQKQECYGKILYQLPIQASSIIQYKEMAQACPLLTDMLANPAVTVAQKYSVIDKICADNVFANFLKLVCRNGCMEEMEAILEAYRLLLQKRDNRIDAVFTYVTEPSKEHKEGIQNMICKKYNKDGVFMQWKQDASLIGGFVLMVGEDRYDKSLAGALRQLHQTFAWG